MSDTLAQVSTIVDFALTAAGLAVNPGGGKR